MVPHRHRGPAPAAGARTHAAAESRVRRGPPAGQLTLGATSARVDWVAGGAGTMADALGNCNLLAVFKHREPADAKERSLRLGDFDRTEYKRQVDPETGEATGWASPKREAVPYANARTIATLPDYHAFVVRPGDTRPNAERHRRAVPASARAAPLPVWSRPVARWKGAEGNSAIAEVPAGGPDDGDGGPGR